MGTKEIWRVVMADGAVKELTPLFTAQPHTNPPRYGYGQYSYPSIRALIVAIAGDPQHMWDVQEIVAPGELTRAELTNRVRAVLEREGCECGGDRSDDEYDNGERCLVCRVSVIVGGG